MRLKPGDRVRHTGLPEWGLGQVLAVDGDKVRVFFVGAGERVLKAAVAGLECVEGAEAAHAALDHLRHDAAAGFRSMSECTDRFLSLFPGGFADPDYVAKEREYKVAAHEVVQDELAAERLRSLLQHGAHGDIVRLAVQVLNRTNLVFPNEKMGFRDALRDDHVQCRFAEHLIDLLYGDDEFAVRFDRFVVCLDDAKAMRWTVATYFPFLAFPHAHMFMKPGVTQAAAEACAFELRYRSEPNARTYEALLAFAQYLFDALADLAPRDMIDVQSFIWCIGDEGFSRTQRAQRRGD